MQEQESAISEFKSRLLASNDGGGENGHAGRGRGARLALRATLGAAAAGTLAYALLVRPWHLRWGATDQEAASEMPGDELLPHSRMQTTRAITIEAPAAQIWPWLVQMGQGGGGLYSYDWLENLVVCDIHSADRIVPDLQELHVGDRVRLGPEGYPFFTVASILPERALVLTAGLDEGPEAEPREPVTAAEYVPASTWAFLLEPIDEGRTRLVVRLRGDWEESTGMTLFNRVLLEPAHFLMERKMIQGIKQRAEHAAHGDNRADAHHQ